jgi:hypothetical protein
MADYVDYTKRLLAIVEEVCQEYKLDHALKFWLLSESWRWRWFGFTGALCAWLGYYIIEHNWIGYEKNEEHCIEAAFKIETALRWINANGDRIVVSLQTKAPTIIFSRSNPQGQNKRWYLPLNTTQAIFPFDWCVMFSWNVADVSSIERTLTKHAKRREHHAERIKNLDEEITMQWNRTSYIAHLAQESKFFQALFDAFVITVAQFIVTVKEILERNDDEYKIISAIHYLNEITHLAELMQWNQQLVQDIHIQFNESATSEREILGCIPLYFGKYWWSYLLATPYGTISELLNYYIEINRLGTGKNRFEVGLFFVFALV